MPLDPADTAEIDLIADAVCAELVGKMADWGLPEVVPQVTDTVIDKVQHLNGVHVSVVPIEHTPSIQARGNPPLLRLEYSLNIDVRHATRNTTIPNRRLKRLTERVAEYWHARTPAAYTAACCIESASSAFQPEKLVNEGIFATVTALTFLAVRTAR